MLLRNEPELSPAGEWYRNRDEWVRHILSCRYLTADQKNVASFIAMHMNRHDNHNKHQQTTIAKDLSVDVSTVKRAIRRLRDEGLIDVECAARGRKRRAVNRYFLIFSWDVQGGTSAP